MGFTTKLLCVYVVFFYGAHGRDLIVAAANGRAEPFTSTCLALFLNVCVCVCESVRACECTCVCA